MSDFAVHSIPRPLKAGIWLGFGFLKQLDCLREMRQVVMKLRI